ncbi:MAG: thioredoxin family protein [Thermoleophilaceae bacterium]|nr:thioredoxin family protein [Thermoleophilaceae bacterium]
MKMEILYFDGCPTYEAADETLRDVLAEQGAEVEVELVAVNTDEEAQRLRFPGSPTIRADGEDLFPVPDRAAWAWGGCRTYLTPEGLRGAPTPEMLGEALEAKLAAKGGTLAHGRL